MRSLSAFFATCVTLASAQVGYEIIQSPLIPKDSKNSLCSPCVQFGTTGLNTLLNYVLNAGIVGGCSKLCGNLKTKGDQEACDLVCDVVGIKGFVKALNHTDLDPIYFCEILHACHAGPDDASVKLVSVAASPASVVKGHTVELAVKLDAVNASGVGQFSLTVVGPRVSGGYPAPVAQRFLLPVGVPVGPQSLSLQLKVKDETSGDFPAVWQPGSYKFTFEVCQGECDSKHPHSKVFGSMSANFTLTNSSLKHELTTTTMLEESSPYYKKVTVGGVAGCVQASVSSFTAKLFGGKAGTCVEQGCTTPTETKKIPGCCTVQGFKCESVSTIVV